MIRTLLKSAPAVRPFDWVWAQQWRDVLFLHWPVPEAALRPHVPQELDIETFEGDAWVSAVIFRLKVRPRRLPYVPFVSELVEVNLRTYVSCRGMPGINFLSVHAENRFAIAAGKLLTPMPYRRAKMEYRGGEFVSPIIEAAFQTRSDEFEAVRGSLDEFLLERYRLFARDRRGDLLQAEVEHPRWRVQQVEAILGANHLGDEFGLGLSTMPDRMHFSRGVAAKFGRFREID